MLQALRELGAYLIDEEGRGGLDDYLDTEKLEDYDRIIAVQFEREDDGYTYQDVSIFDLEGHESDVMYKWGSPRGGDWTPTSRVTRIHKLAEKEDPETKTDTITRVFEWWLQKSEVDHPTVSSAVREYETHEGRIREDIADAYNQLSGEDVVLTVQFEDDNGDLQFISEFDVFVDAVKDKVAEKWAEKHDVVSRSVEERCTLCHRKRTVLGFAFPFNFYTVDNRKYAPNFEQGRSWENLPLCEDCALELQVGRNFVEENNFSFYIGEPLEYYVIPSFPLDGPHDDPFMQNILSGGEGDEYSFMDAEGFYDTVEPEYPVNLDILFYRMEQSSQKIERHVEDVSPPWMREAQQNLREAYRQIYNELGGETVDYYLDNPESLKQLDTLLHRTLPETYGDPGAYLSDALEFTEQILTGGAIEYDRLIGLFDDEIQSRLRNNDNYRGYVLRTFLFLTFILELEVLRRNGTTMKEYTEIKDDWAETVPEPVSEFFDDFPAAFDTAAKRAVFLEGVLAQHLIDVQSQVRNSQDAPLRKKLSGLRLTAERAQTLLPDLYQDIDAYDRKSDFPVEYRALRTATARYFAEADDEGWKLSDEEVRYYFVLGMSLNRVFKPDTDDEESDTTQALADEINK